MFEEQEALVNRAFTQTSPRYEITDTNDKFQVAVDVPGFTSKDIHVNIDNDNRMLSISGSREKTGDDYSFSSKFSQSFSMNPEIDVDHFSANLKDGVLVIEAPKDLKKIEESVRRIPITEAKHATDEVVEEKPVLPEEETKAKVEKIPIEKTKAEGEKIPNETK
jgi:HSP20 family protein